MTKKIQLEVELPEGMNLNLEDLEVGEDLLYRDIRVKILKIQIPDQESRKESEEKLRMVQDWFSKNNLLPDDPVAFKNETRGEL